MAFTKKTFEMVARIGRVAWVQTTDSKTICDMMESFADQFASDNPRFDRERFRDAWMKPLSE